MCRPEHRHPAHRHSIFCILPPYLLRNIAAHSTDANARRMAADTLMLDLSMRTLRSTNLAARPLGRPMPTRLAPAPQKQRTIFDAHNVQQLPGTLVRAEGSEPSKDVAVNEAYDGLGDTFDFYLDVFDRNSIDDNGLPLNATVHYGTDYDNAFWDSHQMVFGDGDGKIFNRFTISLDVIGHELTHGVTENEAQLVYANQSGALNESMSDVFGSLVKQYKLKQTAEEADWLIGEGLFVAGKVKGVALRSMKAPGTAYDDPILGKDPQPAHMKQFVRTHEDNGGVHINSGIPNHAFYLVATKLGGHAWEQAGKIWYETLRHARLKPNSSFRSFARLTWSVAARLYGEGGDAQQAVAEAWDAVGVDATP